MEKKITIEVMGLLKPDGEKQPRTLPLLDIYTEGFANGVADGELAGTLLVAYQDQADAFLKQHDPSCVRCPAYQLHRSIKHAVEFIIKHLNTFQNAPKI